MSPKLTNWSAIAEAGVAHASSRPTASLVALPRAEEPELRFSVQQGATSRRSLLVALQRLLDPLLVTAVFVGVVSGFGHPLDRAYALLALLIFLLAWPSFRAAGLYRSFRSHHLVAEIPRVLGGCALLLGMLLLIGFASKSTEIFSRRILVTTMILMPFSLLTAHVALRAGLRAARARGRDLRKAVIVGGGPLGTRFAERIRASRPWGIEVAGFFDDDERAVGALGAPVLGNLSQVAGHVKKHGISHVYVTLPLIHDRRLVNLVESLQDTTASVYFVPDVFSFNFLHFSVDDMDGVPIYAVCETPFADQRSWLLKRASDLVIATLVVVATAPLMLLIAAAVKLTSRGPVLFKQRRYGLDGKEIVMFKFRSMRVTEDGDGIEQARRNDPRVTPLGRFLRRTSLDELPQFFNVLAGQMSLVGPRPHAVAHNEKYRQLIRGYMIRHKINPGITGWAQVNGLRGETRTVEEMRRRVEYDLYYLRNWSIWFDLYILLRTLGLLWRDPRAY